MTHNITITNLSFIHPLLRYIFLNFASFSIWARYVYQFRSCKPADAYGDFPLALDFLGGYIKNAKYNQNYTWIYFT